MVAVRVLHLLAMAFFVGGQLFLAAVVVPVLRGDERLRAAARRFGAGSAVALVVLAVTGAIMASHYDDWDRPALSAKLAIVAGIVVLIAWHTRAPRNHALEGLILLGSLAAVVLGVSLAH